MKKCELLPVLNKQDKLVNKAKSLTELACFAGGFAECPQHALNGSMAMVSDLLDNIERNSKVISEAVVELAIVNDAVNGN